MMRSIVIDLLFLCLVSCQSAVNEPPHIPIIKKCECDAGSVKTKSGCEPAQKPQHVILWSEASEQEFVVDITKNSSSVVVQPLIWCPPNTRKEQNEDYVFISLEDARLINAGAKTEHYCLEFVQTPTGTLERRVELCGESVILRTCCEHDQTVDVFGKCTVNPLIVNDSEQVQWLHGFQRHTEGLTCPDGPLTIERLPIIPSLGELKHLLVGYEAKTNSQYCVNFFEDGPEVNLGIVSCNPTMNHIPFCCQMEEAFDLDSEHPHCLSHSASYDFPPNLILPSHGFMPQMSAMNCSVYFSILNLTDSDDHKFLPDGSLVSSIGQVIPFDQYCLGTILHKNTTYPGLSCLRAESPNSYCEWKYVVHSVCLSVSSLFIILTLVVYIGVPDLGKRIGGICLISELISLLIALITNIVLLTYQENLSREGCLTVGIIELIFALASFFWLNVMCYDVWSTFRVLRPFSEKFFSVRVFIKYSLYAWGIPLLVGIVAVVLQKFNVPYNPNFTPEIGCFFANDGDNFRAIHWIYLYGPILVLLFINLAFFVHLGITLMPTQMENRRLFHKSSGNQAPLSNPSLPNTEDMKLYVKLFIIMGLPWLIEVFTSFASVETRCYIWFLDLFNSLRGILIFAIFVCKKSTRDKVRSTWFPSWSVQSDSASDRSRKTSTISMSLTSWLPSIRSRKVSSGYNLNSSEVMESPSCKEDR